MTTIKIYCDENPENYIEVINAVVENDIDDPKQIQLDISLEGLDDIWSYWLGREDAIKLTEYLRQQLKF